MCVIIVPAGAPRWSDGKPPDSIVTVEEEETVELACRTDGHPMPMVTWTINGQPLTGTAQRSFVFLLILVETSTIQIRDTDEVVMIIKSRLT